MSNTTSVIMVEAATLALATSVASLVNLQNPNYLSDNKELVPSLLEPHQVGRPFRLEMVERRKVLSLVHLPSLLCWLDVAAWR